MAKERSEENNKVELPPHLRFQLFQLAGTTGKRLAMNLITGVVVQEDTVKGHYFLYAGGSRHAIKSDLPLEEIVGLPVEEGQD